MTDLRQKWYRVPSSIRKPLVLMLGIAIIIPGIIMLVFPGPGWVVIFAGFAILATEFAFAAKVRDWLIEFVQRATVEAKRRWQRFRQPKKKR